METSTPSTPQALFGYAARDQIAEAANQPLEANFVALPTDDGIALLVGLDTLFAGPSFADELHLALVARGVTQVTEVLPVASHTHTGASLDPGKPLLGTFDAGYLRLPSQVLVTLMKVHQKYFAVVDPKEGALMPHFVVVAGTEPTDPAVSPQGVLETITPASE